MPEKMNILLVNIDSKIPNLALARIEKYHQDRGDRILWDLPIYKSIADKIYVSAIFDWNKSRCLEWVGDKSEIGGTGWNIEKRLPQEIEEVKARINWGFTTRGCIRRCAFCCVPQKEGNLHVVGDIYDIWDGKSKNLAIMDNNILGAPEHFKKICFQLRKENIKVDFNQGLDIRLLDDDTIEDLKTIPHARFYRFAWDGKEELAEKFEWVYQHLKRCQVYVLCGFNSSFEEDLRKINTLRAIGHDAYCMRYDTCRKDKKYILLARWVNQHNLFKFIPGRNF